MENTEARERVLVAAERLFAEHGYQAVSLRDIAQAIGLRHASLYHHIPQGKEELFVEVTARRMQKYRAGLMQAVSEAGLNWNEQLYAAAHWMLEQPHMHLSRMLESDMHQISASAAEKLRISVFRALLQPITQIFTQALRHNPQKQARSATYAGMFFSLIEGIDMLPNTYLVSSREELLDVVLDVFINGIRPS